MVIIENKYNIEQIVYLKTDIDQYQRIVISIEYFKGGELLYKLACGKQTSPHYEFEISAEIDITVKQQ